MVSDMQSNRSEIRHSREETCNQAARHGSDGTLCELGQFQAKEPVTSRSGRLLYDDGFHFCGARGGIFRRGVADPDGFVLMACKEEQQYSLRRIKIWAQPCRC